MSVLFPSRIIVPCKKDPLNRSTIKKNMDRKLKLIWDFKGPSASQTAAHHEKHLKEFIVLEGLPLNITGHTDLHDMHSIAFMVVPESKMIPVRDALKPHRGEVYEE